MNVFGGLQSKKLCPTPFECTVWHAPLQHAGFAGEVAHSQPSLSGGVPALQSMRPVLHLYEHVVPLQLAAPVFVLHAAFLHPPHVAVDESDDSQPFVSPAVVSQLAKPGAQPPYVQFVPVHVAPVLVLVSHERPQTPQFVAVVVGVSQPFVSGGVVLQLAKPIAQPVYLQVVPPSVSQAAPTLCVVSHVPPHAAHAAAIVGFSHPSMSGGVVLQSANPGLQPV